jgi:hypothetical protein
MRTKALLMCAFLLASLFVIVVTPASAEIPVGEYEITKYDPMDDVMRVRTGGDFKYIAHNNVEIQEITSSYDDSNPLIPMIDLTMRVRGQIKDSDDYKYAFTVISDNDEYIFAAFQDGNAIGFQLGSNTLILGVDGSGANTNTLSISFPSDQIGPPNSHYDVFGAAVYSVEDSERFLDLAPDKLNLIIEPSDGSTVSGTISIKGVIREYDSGSPSGTVKVKIDTGSWEDVSGSDPWSYSLDTTTLSNGEHTIYTEIEGTEFEDNIKIYVDQNTGSYDSFSFSDNRRPKVGDEYEYIGIGDAKISGINLPIASDMEVKVTDFTRVEGKDTFQIETHSEGEQDLGYIRYSNTIDRKSWRDKDELGTVKETTVSTVEVTFRPDTEVNTTTEYTPPLENHNGFEVTVGYNNKWTFSSTADAESVTTVAGGGDPTEDSYSETLSGVGECLYHLSSHSVPEGTYSDIYVIRLYYENPGISILEYYSPELGIPIQIDTYDASRNLMFSLGAERIDQVDVSVIIEDIIFDPAKPKAKTDNNIIVSMKNIDIEDASNVKLNVYDGDKEVGEKTFSITAGQSTDETIKWSPNTDGSHTIRVTISHSNKVLVEETRTIEVEASPDDGGEFPLWILLLVVIIVVILVLVLVMRGRGKKTDVGPPAEGQQAEAAPAQPAPTPAPAAPVAAAPAAAPQTQMNQETIQCPSCKNGFTVEYKSKPVKVKCPNCGMEGVLN